MEILQPVSHACDSNKKTMALGVSSTEPEQTETTVFLPDLFVSFCSRAPKINPFYAEVKAESEAWFANLYGMKTQKELSKLNKAEIALFAAYWSGDAGKLEYRTICDWCHWVFYFDDQFDEGHLCEDKDGAQREADILMQIMTVGLKDDEYANDLPRARALRFVFRSIWERISQRASLGVQRRFREAMEDFCKGLVGQVRVRAAIEPIEIDTYLALRRRSIGVVPCIVLAEYYHDLRLPDEFFEHPSVKNLMGLATEITILHNDVLSYHKEYEMGVIHNIVTILRQRNMTQQEAYIAVDKLIHKRLREWHLAVHQLPFYGEKLDVQVQKFVQACMEVFLANLYWSFASERYFGNQNKIVRETREVRLIKAKV